MIGSGREAATGCRIECEIKARGAEVYAGFFLRHLQPGMVVLDCGCGNATITIGLAEALPAGRIVGVDLGQDSLRAARRNASAMGRRTLFARPPMGDACRFPRRRSTRFFATP
jgi:methylase of polypeptide subunit release factors